MNSPVLADPSSVGERLAREYHAADDVFDEMLASPTVIRPHWQRFVEALENVSPQELDRRRELADQLVYENGVTYNARATPEDVGRPWELDVLPVVFAEAEWERLSAAIAQRARLLDRIVSDLYGSQELIRRGLLPAELVFANTAFLRPAHGLRSLEHGLSLPVYSAELARSPEGQWWVMADRTAAPVGCGYALENRIVISRTWPQLIQDCRTHRLASFFMQMQQTLQKLAPTHRDNPHITLLSPGPADPYYFEDAFLARYLGLTLVEGGDLAVRDEKVWLKTLGGLLPVDVILRRVPEAGIDPLELGGGTVGGVPGLLQSIRAGHVAVANPIGSELVESPVFMSYLPAVCRELFGEDLAMPSIATWWCRDADQRKYVLDHLDELVVKPAFDPSGSQEIIVDRLSKAEIARLREAIQAKPYAYVAQETICRSSTPTWRDGRLQPGHVALRAYAVEKAGNYVIMPGGLVRVSATSGPIELSISAGDESKDAWVLADRPVQHVSLLTPTDKEVRLQRTGASLPSRVADNLYWLGRQLERVDNSARLLRTIVDRLTIEPRLEAVSELPALVRLLASRGLIEPGFAVEVLKSSLPRLEDVLLRAVYEDDEPLSLRRTMHEVVRLTSIVRDRVSMDTWRMVNRMDRRLRRTLQPSMDLGDALHQLDRLVSDVAACYGLATDSMTRSQAWRFLDIGRRVERSLQTISLLQDTLARLTENDVPVLQAVLEVADSSMTYRARYMSQLRRAPVLDLLLTDETNPRSLGFQLVVLHDHVENLPREAVAATRSAEQKSIMTALHQVRMGDAVELCRPRVAKGKTLDQLLSKVEREVAKLSDLLTRRYLVHAGPPRQMDEPPRSGM